MKERRCRSGAVLGAGTILTRATPVYDIVREQVYRSTADAPLIIPENAVWCPGRAPSQKEKPPEWGLSLYTPVIVKYRDEKTQGSIETGGPAALKTDSHNSKSIPYRVSGIGGHCLRIVGHYPTTPGW